MQATESCAQKLVVLGLVGPESIVVANSSWTGLAGAATYFSLAASDYGLQASVITHTEPGVTDALLNSVQSKELSRKRHGFL